MNKQDAAKQHFIQAMKDVLPDNELVQKSAEEMQEDTLLEIVNAMIPGIASHPQYDALIPALQQAMDALREIKPDTNASAKQSVMTYRAIFTAPNALPPMSKRADESNEGFATRVIRSAEEWTE